MSKQKLTLEVDKVFLLRRKNHMDMLVIGCEDNEALKEAVGDESAKANYDNELSFSIRVTHGTGEALAQALGLIITDRHSEIVKA